MTQHAIDPCNLQQRIFIPTNSMDEDILHSIITTLNLRRITYVATSMDTTLHGYSTTIGALHGPFPDLIPTLARNKAHRLHIDDDHLILIRTPTMQPSTASSHPIFTLPPLPIDHDFLVMLHRAGVSPVPKQPENFGNSWEDAPDLAQKDLGKICLQYPDFYRIPVIIEANGIDDADPVSIAVTSIIEDGTPFTEVDNLTPFKDPTIVIDGIVVSMADFLLHLERGQKQFLEYIDMLEAAGQSDEADEAYTASDSILHLLIRAQVDGWTGPALLISPIDNTHESIDEDTDSMTTTTSPHRYVEKTNNEEEWIIPGTLLTTEEQATLRKMIGVVDAWEYANSKGEMVEFFCMKANQIDEALGRPIEAYASKNVADKIEGKYVAIALTSIPVAAEPNVPEKDTSGRTILLTASFYSQHKLYNPMYNLIVQNGQVMNDRYTKITKTNSSGVIEQMFGYAVTPEEYTRIIADNTTMPEQLRNPTSFPQIDGYHTAVHETAPTPTTTPARTSTYAGSSYNSYSPSAELIQAPPMPIIHFSSEALARMGYYVGLCDDEIGWLGTVERVNGDATTPDVLTIREVFLLRQGVHATTTELEASAISEMSHQIMEEDNYDLTRINSLLVWGHSHVRMGTSPSGQDDSQMRIFEENESPYMLRIIANKLGDIRVDLFDYDRNIKWERLPWSEEPDPVLMAAVEDELSMLTIRTA